MEAAPKAVEMLLAGLVAASVVFGLCASAVIRRKCTSEEDEEKQPMAEKKERLEKFKEKIVNSLQWGKLKKMREVSEPAIGQGVLPLLASPVLCSGGGGSGEWGAGAAEVMSSSPVWQRRILMGERCELPRFSGLILYDEKGLPLRGSSSSVDPMFSVSKEEPIKEEATIASTTTKTKSVTLRDLLR
ncbi:uncharacterized protein LOC144701496 [Wolffia australiana]